jgi:phosphohistidine phosphatase SixA
MWRPSSWLVVLVAFVMSSSMSSVRASEEFWSQFKKPNRVVLLRHAYAPEDPPDRDLDNLKNCKMQRNLNEAGRAQARRTGDQFRKHGIRQARIYSSQFCRALETGRLLKLGPVAEQRMLNQRFYTQPFALREAAGKTGQFLKGLRGKGPVVLISHVSNIQALAGVRLSSGEMAVVHLDPAGEIAVDSRLLVK